MRATRWFAVALVGAEVALVLAGCASSGAAPRPAYAPVVAPGTLRLSPQDAERRLRAAIGRGARVHLPGRAGVPVSSVRRAEVLDDRVRVEVEVPSQAALAEVELPLSDPLPRIEERGHAMFRVLLVRFDAPPLRLMIEFPPERMAEAQELVDVFANLRSAPEEDPAVVARFDAAVADQRAGRARSPRPELPPDARRLKVEAELAVEQRRFQDAAELFGQALAVAPWWPEGHYNRALVLGELRRPAAAARSMKRYLALVPDAPDAQAAQDRIYAWEAMARRRSAP